MFAARLLLGVLLVAGIGLNSAADRSDWSDYDGDDDADYADDDSSYTTWCDELADADEERSSTPTDQSTTQSAALTTRLVLSLDFSRGTPASVLRHRPLQGLDSNLCHGQVG